MRGIVLAFLVLACAAAPGAAQVDVTRLRVEVRSDQGPLEGASVGIGDVEVLTDATGVAIIPTPPGPAVLVVHKEGFLDATQELTIGVNGMPPLLVTLLTPLEIEEDVVVVASTRTGRRLDDQATRVEVLGRDEIEEKMLMTPGDIVMMLNETGGLRVQATSPSIGAASVRVQGMQGRYTRVLGDGLPLFGQQVGGLGLLQIPPMDLGQVEVIKGTASALYGAGAMGGVVNLLSRRPGREPVAEMLVNRSTLGATDAVVFASSRQREGWSGSLLGSGHWQAREDRDGDGWADVAGYARGIARPRVFWDGGEGRSALLTVGFTHENRDGGTMPGGVVRAIGAPYVESLDTRRVDVGATAQALVAGRFVLTARGAAAWQRHDHAFGDVRERDRHHTVFAEAAVRGAAGRHTWVARTAYERDVYDPRDVPRFAYAHDVPGVFVQDDIDVARWMAISASARLDVHDRYGTFLSPRLAVLLRGGDWTSRVSAGRGFFAATPLTEETEAAGLSRLTVAGELDAERGTSVSADLTRRIGAASYTATVFGSRVDAPIGVERSAAYTLFTRDEATTNVGMELLATLRAGRYAATGSYVYVRSRETTSEGRHDVALTPRHSAGIVGTWEADGVGRIGLECYYTGRQRLEVNPSRHESRPYVVVGALAERRFGRVRAFVNAENISGVRQTRWEPLVRPSQGPDGRWTVDAWAPLDGRVFNAGVRLAF